MQKYVLHGHGHAPLQRWSKSVWTADHCRWHSLTLGNSKTKSQRGESKWLLKYLITPNSTLAFLDTYRQWASE